MPLKVPALTDREQEALAYFWVIHWFALALSPGTQRNLRGLMQNLGLVKPKGKLALSPVGKQIVAFAKAEGRPRYPKKRAAQKRRR
jgi:hypothetical protein